MSYPRKTALLAAVFLAALIVHLWVASGALQRFPNSGDEYSYLLQAELLASGRLSAKGPPLELRDAFATDHVLDQPTVRSKYPPGWPALLSLGELLGVAWVVNPVLGALIVLMIAWLLLERSGPFAALLGAVILLLSPMAVLNASSFFSHTGSLFFMTVGVFLLTRRASPSPAAWFSAGLMGGLCFLVRPLDGLLFSLSLGLGWLSTPRRPAGLIGLVLGGLPGGALFLLYNHLQFGGPFTTGYALYLPEFARLYGASEGRPDLTWRNMLELGAHMQWVFDFLFQVPLVFLAPFGVLAKRDEDRLQNRLLLTLVVLTLLTAQALKRSAGDSYGPRYLFVLLLPAAILSASGIERLRAARLVQLGRFAPIAALSILLLSSASKLSSAIDEASAQVSERIQLYRVVERSVSPPALVLLESVDAYGPHWYTRNGPDRDRPILFARPASPKVLAALLSAYPNHQHYRYRRGGRLFKARTPVRPPGDHTLPRR